MDEHDNIVGLPHKSPSITPRPQKSWSLLLNNLIKERWVDVSIVSICNHCKKQLTTINWSNMPYLNNALNVHSSRSEMDEHDSTVGLPRKSPSITPRPRKSWSLVWNDFTKERRADGSTVAICNHCKKQLTASSRSGTTHLKNHLVICTSDRRVDGRKKRKKLIVRRATVRHDEAGAVDVEQFKFDQESARQDLARMIILHQYPMTMVEDVGFKTFVQNLQPQFNMVPYDVVKADCMRIYEITREKLYELLGRLQCRVSLSLETWRTGGEMDYACLTCHYVDNDWKLQKKTLNLIPFEALSTGEEICKAVSERIYDWNIAKKLFCVVLDNLSSGDEAAGLLPKYLGPKSCLVSNGDYLNLHGYGRILDLIVQDGFAQIRPIIDQVRECVRHVRSSQSVWRKFQEAAKQVRAPENPLILDDPACWTSTYEMLATACEFQGAFVRLAVSDVASSSLLSSVNWDYVKDIVFSIDLFYQAMKKFASFPIATANLYFQDIFSIYLLLKDACNSLNEAAVSMASQMLKTFEQYWGITRIGMAIASILDPRYKMKSIEFFFKKFYEGEYEVIARINEVRKSFTSLYNEYVVHSARSSSNQALLCYAGSNGGSNNTPDGVMKSASRITLSDARRGLDQYLQESSSGQSIKTDLDMYLEEGVHPFADQGHDDNFNVLAWWRVNAPKYPILSMMARDILAAPMSVAALDVDNRSLTQYMSIMDPLSVQSMVCAHDWLKDEVEAATLDSDVGIVPVIGDELCPVSVSQ